MLCHQSHSHILCEVYVVQASDDSEKYYTNIAKSVKLIKIRTASVCFSDQLFAIHSETGNLRYPSNRV